jgi:hypothetical protein
MERPSGAEAAQRLGLSVDAALKAKSNVTRLLRGLMREMGGESDEAAHD